MQCPRITVKARAWPFSKRCPAPRFSTLNFQLVTVFSALLFDMRQHVGEAVDEDLVDAFFQYPAQLIADHGIGQWADAGDKVRQFGHVFAFGEASSPYFSSTR